MKRFSALLLALAVLFSSCAPVVPDSSVAVETLPRLSGPAYHSPEPAARVSTFRYGRSFMSGYQAALYDSLSPFLAEMDENNILQVGGDLQDSVILNIIDTFLTENPVYYWAILSICDDESVRGIRLTLAIPIEEITRQRSEIEVRAHEILAPVRGADDFTKALAIFRALAVVEYSRCETNVNNSNLYGILVEGAATCMGYASGFYYLANLAGLDSVILIGQSQRGIYHAWNAVRLDSSWHFVDATWGRPLHPNDGIYHAFFLMNTEEMLQGRVWDSSQYPMLPQPSEGFACYFERMGYSVSGVPGEDAVEILAEIFYRQLAAKELSGGEQVVYLEMKVIGSPEEYQLWRDLFIRELFNIQRHMHEISVADGAAFVFSNMSSIRCNYNDTVQVLMLYPLVMAPN